MPGAINLLGPIAPPLAIPRYVKFLPLNSGVLQLSWTEQFGLTEQPIDRIPGMGSYLQRLLLTSRYDSFRVRIAENAYMSVRLRANFDVASEPIFPVMIGVGWPFIKSPIWDTRLQTSITGHTTHLSGWTYPRWHFKLTVNVMNESDYETYVGFFLGRQGRAFTFLFDDVTDDAVVNMPLGFSAQPGNPTAWQLTRTVTPNIPAVSAEIQPHYVEPIFAPKPGVVVSIAGVPQTAIISPLTGMASVPARTVDGSVTWTGGFYWRCRFAEDLSEFDQFVHKLYALHTIDFETVKQ